VLPFLDVLFWKYFDFGFCLLLEAEAKESFFCLFWFQVQDELHQNLLDQNMDND